MRLCRIFSVPGFIFVFVLALACGMPLKPSAATHHRRTNNRRAHHRHRARRRHHLAAATISAPALAPKDPGSPADAASPQPADTAANVAAAGIAANPPTRITETRSHARRRLRGQVPPQRADAALFIPPARIRHVPPPIRGTYASLIHQNKMASEEHIGRVADDEDLSRMRSAGLLVPIPVTAVLRVNPDLPANRRYTRPWTARFLSDVSRAHYKRYHSYIQVNSAVRTVAFQRALLLVNANAAPADGGIASPHLTGQTIDIAKHDLNPQEIAWMRLYLAPLVRAGKIDVAEEFQQACFHISVYKSYLPAVKSAPITRTERQHVQPAPTRRRNSSTALLAARLH